jgi:drug/metabolite transporter (DMT)-like permease
VTTTKTSPGGGDNPRKRRISERTLAACALALAAITWGTAAVGAKTALRDFPPFILAELRWAIALLFLWPLMRRAGEAPTRGRGAAVLGLTGLFLFYLFYSFGLKHTTAANATLIGGGTPVVVALLSAIFLGERMERRKGIGIALSLAGVATIVGFSARLDGSLAGNLLVVGSSLSWAIYTVVNRKMASGGGSLGLLVGAAAYGMLFMAPPALLELRFSSFGTITPSSILLLLYLALGPSAAAYLLWGYGLSKIEASQAAVYGNLMPLFGVVAAALFLDERITGTQLIGGAGIVAGVWTATTTGRKFWPGSFGRSASPEGN